jgi:uncharacterized membrane protein YhhN
LIEAFGIHLRDDAPVACQDSLHIPRLRFSKSCFHYRLLYHGAKKFKIFIRTCYNEKVKTLRERKMGLRILIVIGCLIQLTFIYCDYKGLQKQALFTKTAAAFVFVVVGFVCAGYHADRTFAGLVLAGLFCGFAGDVLLRLRYLFPRKHDLYFALGTGAFMLGHGVYIAALIGKTPGCFWSVVIVCAAVCAPLAYFLSKITAPPPKLKLFGGVYIAVVVFMSVAAWFLFAVHPEIRGAMRFALGATFFTLSDILLTVSMFGRNKTHKKIFSAVNLVLYYAAQLLIALSLKGF